MFTVALFIIKSGNNPNIHSWWMGKQNVAYPYNEILFALKSNEDLIHAVICIKPC